MNVKKTLAILEILCPMFRNAEGKNGSVNYNTPEGHLLFLPEQAKIVFRAIWCPDNEVLNATERLFRFIINMIFTLALMPVMLVIWIISQLVFAMHYDHKQREHGSKSYLMLMYSTLTILFISLIAMTINYYQNKEPISIDLTQQVLSGINLESEPEPKRNIIRTYKEEDNFLVVTESEHKQSSDSDGCSSSAIAEPEPELTISDTIPEPESNLEAESNDDYTVKRKVRD